MITIHCDNNIRENRGRCKLIRRKNLAMVAASIHFDGVNGSGNYVSINVQLRVQKQTPQTRKVMLVCALAEWPIQKSSRLSGQAD
jgi:hypothetical protein